jgi:hypothetical protein
MLPRSRFWSPALLSVGSLLLPSPALGADVWPPTYPERARPVGIKCSGMLGYRVLPVNYRTGEGAPNHSCDVLQQGPVGGLALSF